MENSYKNIIGLPHHISKTRKRMSRLDRAAQFAAFQALSGFGDDIKEKARLTDRKIELNEEERFKLNETLSLLITLAKERPYVKITYFIDDAKKDGGAYVITDGNFRRIDELDQLIILTNGTQIPIDDVFDISLAEIQIV